MRLFGRWWLDWLLRLGRGRCWRYGDWGAERCRASRYLKRLLYLSRCYVRFPGLPIIGALII